MSIYPLKLIATFLTAMVPALSGAAPLFNDKALVAPHIHVESASQFVKWSGKPVPQGDYDKAYYNRTRLGTVSFGPQLKVHVDMIEDMMHFPSYYELVDVVTGAVLGKYAVFNPDDAEWYFAGNGMAYLNQLHLSLCGPRYTRKIVQKEKALAEAVQPLIYIGAETQVQGTVRLFESPTSKNVVATLAPGTTAFVIGLQPGKDQKTGATLLVKTPFGLTGWHVADGAADNGALEIYQCN